MWQEIERLKADEGLTILLTTHYMDEADQLASQLAIVDRGSVVAEGSPAELKASLQGDAVHLELEGANVNGNVHAALEGVPGLCEVLVEGRALHARVDDGGRAVPAVLAALDAHSVPVATVTVARPSLDDVYLRYAGRSFSEADHKEDNE
jgi:ABC-2 type transport system ATP-binding protein